MVNQCNCKNCAAPLPQANQFSKCDYCGSDFRVTSVPDGVTIKKNNPSFSSLSKSQKFAVIMSLCFFPSIMYFYLRKL